MEGIDINYSSSLTKNQDDWVLLDLPQELLNEIESGRSLIIKGEAHDEAIICGDSASYILKSNETSNLLMILLDNTIEKEAYSIISCEKIIPPLHQINTLLEESPYTFEDKKRTQVYTFEDLTHKVQASPKEISDHLQRLSSFEYDGYVRIFDEEFRVETLKNVLYFVMKYDWETITVLDVVNELKIVPIKIVEALLATVGSVHVYWEPDLLKVYQLCAIELFLNNPEYFLDQFEQSYYRLTEFLIPRRMIFDFPLYKVLQGLAISRVSNSKPTVRYFPVTKLSFNFQDRLNFLFSIKEKWTEDEIGIYLADILTMPLPKVLLKHTKRVIENNIPLYTNKLI